MAQLPKPLNDRPYSDLPLAPAGTHLATLIEVKDQFGVQRKKFDNHNEIETVDLTCFLFGFRDGHNQPWKVASRQMLISGHEKSGLYKMLTSMLGRPPAYGWDYMELRGRRFVINLIHKASRDNTSTYAEIASIMPEPAGSMFPQQPPAGYPHQTAAAPGYPPQPNPQMPPTGYPQQPPAGYPAQPNAGQPAPQVPPTGYPQQQPAGYPQQPTPLPEQPGVSDSGFVYDDVPF